jgi:DNA-binding CsgD family transcriptional regulator
MLERRGSVREIVRRLTYLIPHDFAITGFAKIDGNGKLESYNIINISYPAEWLNLYFTRKYYQVDPIVKENFTKFRLQYWTDTYKTNAPPKEFLSTAQDFGLENGYTIGIGNLNGTKGSLMSISGKSVEHRNRTQAILELFISHLHEALSRILDQNNVKYITSSLSPREMEILKWIGQGKSSWDISMILGISERTVNFHVNNIKQKLEVVNRTQAVAIAIQLGLIDIE